MNNYAITQSKEEIRYTYSRLIDKLNGHVKLLSENSLPFTSIMGMIRGLRKLNLNYLENEQTKDNDLTEKELLLADKVHRTFNVDIIPALQLRLLGEQQMKKALVLHEYDLMAKTGLKAKDIKEKLSKEYGVSVSVIEKWFYRKN